MANKYPWIDEASAFYAARCQWEYMVINPVDRVEDYNRVSLAAFLNELGADDWMLCQVIDQSNWVFIRPKRGDA